ncbi:hypothetical protein A2875_05030 [Candidatus Gottesmanbacteria bacterium RIFCSPHIGHO2_01_FULL_46_14]|uniref:Ig-like domain-containing protein n=1 Tax=Candidatus Gottesmanbacteria bacterium RIFCSPHIGHO2_01_FULL_46_14 TaxID=1798380 RepID=A0A1F5ZRH1_9BACT|nr:MAG: hypothetical protein A2875_05030 [Candidatus Gottesmanbacteria bacterium RIFCSPHIGHO2_01_FULL_46_14]
MRAGILGSLLLLVGTITPKAYAQTVPSFPSCSNPQGSVKVSYSEGTHGIVGNGGTFMGSDTVYTLSEGTTTQCFCADNGDGTQTNWWHAASLTEAEIQVLKNQGWISVPNGALWGLTEGEWLAFNNSYSCQGRGQILAASTGTGGDVLGLATTGNILTIYALAGFGVASVFLSVLLRKNS